MNRSLWTNRRSRRLAILLPVLAVVCHSTLTEASDISCLPLVTSFSSLDSHNDVSAMRILHIPTPFYKVRACSEEVKHARVIIVSTPEHVHGVLLLLCRARQVCALDRLLCKAAIYLPMGYVIMGSKPNLPSATSALRSPFRSSGITGLSS